MGWIGDQLQNPIVAAAIAFVAGGIFTAVIDMFAREISAERADGRQRRRELRQLRLADIATTQRWVLAYSEYVRKQWYDEGLQWDPERYVGVRPGLIGDETVLRRLTAALSQVLKRDPHHPAVIDEMVELEGAEEGAHRALGEQTERIIAGLEPNLISEAVVAELTSEVSLARDWYRKWDSRKRTDALAPPNLTRSRDLPSRFGDLAGNQGFTHSEQKTLANQRITPSRLSRSRSFARCSAILPHA